MDSFICYLTTFLLMHKIIYENKELVIYRNCVNANGTNGSIGYYP